MWWRREPSLRHRPLRERVAKFCCEAPLAHGMYSLEPLWAQFVEMQMLYLILLQTCCFHQFTPYLSKWSTKASRVLLGGHSFGPDAALLPQGRYFFSALLWWALWRPGKRRLLGQLWHLRTVTRSALFAVLAWFWGHGVLTGLEPLQLYPQWWQAICLNSTCSLKDRPRQI